MRPGAVVVHPLIKGPLSRLQIRESCPVLRNSARILRWKRSILPVVVGLRGWVSRCSIPLSRQMRSKSTSTGGWLNRPVNTLPLSVKICSGAPLVASAPANLRRPRGCARVPSTVRTHTFGSDHRAGQGYGAGAIGQRESAHDVHLPQLHRRAAFPAFPLARASISQLRVNHRRPHQGPIGRRLRRQRRHPAFGQLEHQPPRPQYGRDRRNSNNAASTAADI
jgi:hypothetical protein